MAGRDELFPLVAGGREQGDVSAQTKTELRLAPGPIELFPITEPSPDEWMETFGMLSGDPLIDEIFEAGAAIRRAEHD